MPRCPVCRTDVRGGMIRHVVRSHEPYEDATLSATQVFQSPDASSLVVVVVEAGTPVATKPHPEGEWCDVVTEMGVRGYVHNTNVTFLQPRSKTMAESDFGKAFAWTAVPISLLGIISTAGAAVPNLYLFWYAGVLGGFVALIVALATLGGRRFISAGIGAGLAVGALALTITCYANLATVDLLTRGEATATPVPK